jgi:hypothetical protein
VILPEIVSDLERFAQGYQPRMLMLGAQECIVPGVSTSRDWFRRYVGDEYDELDLIDGDLRLDLNADLSELGQCYGSVFNLGTIEHVWDVRMAWINAMRAVTIDGWFLSHSPLAGWVDADGNCNHGIHRTRREAILEFVARNGFEIVDQWETQFRRRGTILWFRARKTRHVQDAAGFEPPMFLRGRGPRRVSVAP